MKVLVTGAGGFLGTEIACQLSSDGNHQIYALTSQGEKLKSRCGNGNHLVILERNDIFREHFPFEDIDCLINCAFPRNEDGVQMADGLKYIGNVLSTAVSGGVKSVINISSQSVYSQIRKKAAAETATLDLESRYAVGKYAAELLTNTICRDIPHTNIRMASLIGAGFDQRLVNKFVKQVMSGKDINIKGGRQVFGFLDVRDAASAIIRVMEGAGWDEVYNLGPEKDYSLAQIAESVQENIVECGYERTETILTESDDWLNSSLDSTKLTNQFGWKEKYTLKDTIKMIIHSIVSEQV